MADRVERVGLVGAVQAVQNELVAAMAAGSGSGQFHLGPVELEFVIELEATAGTEAGTRVFVVAESAGHREVTAHRLRVRLDPVDAEQGSPLLIDSDREEDRDRDEDHGRDRDRDRGRGRGRGRGRDRDRDRGRDRDSGRDFEVADRGIENWDRS